ncbi:hypothetical protein G7Y89_g6403 [Cudoniella acicularis]|uniref:F-box domain-containing protein n=1 Tax=Cudoniella acicularis TaxID=354080 RepID=A0A8H4W4T0_9HELO|nr:hypothetical protein G7Y89_g6403 [Cudoniella acicularis]
MGGFKALPKEILRDIVLHLTSNTKDLVACTLASRDLGEAAKSTLYYDVDLNLERCDEEGEIDIERQKILLGAIAENRNLGSLVRNFTNCRSWHGDDLKDATCSSDTELLILAARNLTRLRKASFTMNPLAAVIIDSLPSYSHLSELKIEGISPKQYLWNRNPTSLTTLKWRMPCGWSENQLSYVDSLLQVVESTCPGLTSLDIAFSTSNSRQSELGRLQEYSDITLPAVPTIKLRHFGLEVGRGSSSEEEPRKTENRFLAIVERYRHSLKSVNIPISLGPWTREGLEYILKACKLLPHLSALRLNPTLPYGELAQSHAHMTPYDFLQALTTNLASPGASIERFSVDNIEHHDDDGIFYNDGRPDFRNYRPMTLDFIRELPQSLEEIYLEVNGEGLWCDDDEDFDPFCNLGPEIFKSMRRLHTCDLHAWISNMDGGLGQIPEKSVHYRRLAHKRKLDETEIGGNMKKDVWTSRMDCVYQENWVNVSKSCDVLELDVDEKGGFVGRDAGKVWLGGFTFGRGTEDTDGDEDDEEDDEEEPDYSWPGYRDLVQTYPMYKRSH